MLPADDVLDRDAGEVLIGAKPLGDRSSCDHRNGVTHQLTNGGATLTRTVPQIVPASSQNRAS